MALSAPGQNATVEEILASIRQAISEDDARRTGERRPDPPGAERPSGLGATSVSPFKALRAAQEDDVEAVAEFEADTEADDLPEDAVVVHAAGPDGMDVEIAIEVEADEAEDEAEVDAEGADDVDLALEAAGYDSEVSDETQDVIELAIEKAVSGVRAELEGRRAQQSRMKSRPVDEINGRMGQRPLPDPRLSRSPRREIPMPPPLRGNSLISPRVDAKVNASFEDLAKAMIQGNSHQLNTVVEDLLRPMLKQWLEGNLPQMVERLVREEIERVSRGRR